MTFLCFHATGKSAVVAPSLGPRGPLNNLIEAAFIVAWRARAPARRFRAIKVQVVNYNAAYLPPTRNRALKLAKYGECERRGRGGRG